MKKLFQILILITAFQLQAQNPVPAPKQSKSVLLMNGFLHIGNGKVIENSIVGFRNGVIDLVGDALVTKIDPAKYDTVINIAGKHIYPGFIIPNSTLGLAEVEAVRATLDFNEVGTINPHVRSLIAFNADSKVNSTMRTNGVMYCQVTPRGGLISGTSSVVSLDSWNWEDAVLKMDDGVHLNFPKSQSGSSRRGEEEKKEPAVSQYEIQLNDLKKFFTDSKAYNLNPAKEEKNLRFEAMKGIFNGTQNLYIHTDYVKDILAAVNLCKEFGIKKIVLVGARDAWKVTKELKAANASVMINRVHDLPEKNDDDIDLPYKLAYLLQKDSVLFCLQTAGDQEAPGARNLPFLAGTACAYGLTKEQALMSISYNTAKILGVETKAGSVEQNKIATLFVSEGDALDMRTNKVLYAFIEGRKLNLKNSQEIQYEKYLKKYGVK
ncbi:MAG: amidohydrolase [Bacteroidia bacterium]|nr:amidohydrolase [Bacteroidia bacterium]